VKQFLTLFVVLLIVPGFVFAAGSSDPAAGHAEEHDPHAPFKYSASVRKLAEMTGMSVNAAYWVSVIFNFLIVAGAIGYFLRKKMPGAFRSRTSAIQKGLEEARRTSEEARRRLSEIEGRLARIDTEIGGLESNAEMQAREEEARLRSVVEEERKKIVHAAEQEIARVSNNARRELKIYTTELAISLAEKQMKVDSATDAEIVREFVEQLPSDGSRRQD
jgi:F-type H+-transporting ATPase subunit b